MPINEHPSQSGPSCLSRIATSLAMLSLLFGVISVTASTTVLLQLAWTASVYGLPLLVVTIVPGAIAALLPGASTRTRIVALVGIILGVLSVFLFFTLEPIWCTQHPSACA
jgi:hypothetical protein